MSWVIESGESVASPKANQITATTKARTRSLAMLGLQNQGWSLREIGNFFGVKHPEQVRRAIEAIPAEARRLRGVARVG